MTSEDILCDVFYNDPLCKICQFLDPTSIYNLSLTTKTFMPIIIQSNMMHNSIINNVNDNLYKMFDNKTKEFKNLLEKYKCVISGSFIVQSIIDEYWEGSDIDIYFPIDDTFISNDENTIVETDLDKFICAIPNMVEEHAGSTYGGTDVPEIKWCRTYVVEYKKGNMLKPWKIQIIFVDLDRKIKDIDDDDELFLDDMAPSINEIEINSKKNDEISDKVNKTETNLVSDNQLNTDLWSYIKKSFDFNICKNMYYFDFVDDCFKSYRLKDVITRNTKLSLKAPNNNIISRYEKYTNRGFTIQKPSYTLRELNQKHWLSDIGSKVKIIKVKDLGIKKVSESSLKLRPEYQRYDMKIQLKNNLHKKTFIESRFGRHEDDCNENECYLSHVYTNYCISSSCLVNFYIDNCKHSHYGRYLLFEYE